MINLSTQVFSLLTIIFLSGFFLSYLILRAINKSTKTYLFFIHVKAEKSPTHASLLGGLGLSITFFTAVLSCLLFSKYFSVNEVHILKYSLAPILIVTFYGFMDDKYEIRARHKLVLQFLAITSFALPMSLLFAHNNYGLFLASIVLGLAYINGCNLIDGLDTIFVKLGTCLSLIFLYVSFRLGSMPNVILSLVTIASMASFYLFNREPARIYAGEIGGSILGLLLFVQGNFVLEKALLQPHPPSASSMIVKVLIMSLYPLGELGLSFTRRLLSKQSPFRGDQLHLHHVIKSKFNLKAAQTANVISLLFIVMETANFIVLHRTTPMRSFLFAVSSFSFFYTAICYKHWMKVNSKNNSNEIFFSMNNQKSIYVVDGKSIESFYFQYHTNAITHSKEMAS